MQKIRYKLLYYIDLDKRPETTANKQMQRDLISHVNTSQTRLEMLFFIVRPE